MIWVVSVTLRFNKYKLSSILFGSTRLRLLRVLRFSNFYISKLVGDDTSKNIPPLTLLFRFPLEFWVPFIFDLKLTWVISSQIVYLS